jgi:hypothetical protein
MRIFAPIWTTGAGSLPQTISTPRRVQGRALEAVLYPQQARYDGKSDPTLASSFSCSADDRVRDTPEPGPNFLK